CSFLGGTLLALLTYPTVTIAIVPVTKQSALTTPLALPTRTLAPVTLTRSLTAPATGRGHQDARPAAGVLTLYNGSFSAQTIAAGTVLTGSDGVKVVTDATVMLAPNTPPVDGKASVAAHALQAGSVGNI